MFRTTCTAVPGTMILTMVYFVYLIKIYGSRRASPIDRWFLLLLSIWPYLIPDTSGVSEIPAILCPVWKLWNRSLFVIFIFSKVFVQLQEKNCLSNNWILQIQDFQVTEVTSQMSITFSIVVKSFVTCIACLCVSMYLYFILLSRACIIPINCSIFILHHEFAEIVFCM